ncbi:6-phosphogluconolactonase [Deinococcus cellulosilyticus]|uniref:6-phosphogluconolactonase n=1 Tax=Deinococcus cellulosilyticus (strain DSM 18568 / NBRC 106333 / KACC 11606 / 5516J-15) TaxID=1223518 RepID=A0A511N0S4_DEIC1|nr:6-phosphogluconolactonase [Deinococcus cellulosilyticus]GEM46419.1 6-phosphogluconolactonase [Deinococcus cellulosilyticus NBRC 106333 = KACC 11606]
MQYHISSTPQELGQEAARAFVDLYNQAVQDRGIFTVALSGGSTPVHLYKALAQTDLDWSRVRFYFSDERTVPADHKDSNYKTAKDNFFDGVGIQPEHVFRMEGELDPQEAASRYAAVLPDQLDLCYLGMGDDGHTASLFPDTEALTASGRVVANFVPKLNTWRITFTFEEINRSRNIHILATGANKKEVLLEVKNKSGKHPIEGVENPFWYVDAAIAELL